MVLHWEKDQERMNAHSTRIVTATPAAKKQYVLLEYDPPNFVDFVRRLSPGGSALFDFVARRKSQTK